MSADTISVDELAAEALPEDLECYVHHEYRTGMNAWCPTCNLPSAVEVERVCWLVNPTGVTPLLLRTSKYCSGCDAFMAAES